MPWGRLCPASVRTCSRTPNSGTGSKLSVHPQPAASIGCARSPSFPPRPPLAPAPRLTGYLFIRPSARRVPDTGQQPLLQEWTQAGALGSLARQGRRRTRPRGDTSRGAARRGRGPGAHPQSAGRCRRRAPRGPLGDGPLRAEIGVQRGGWRGASEEEPGLGLELGRDLCVRMMEKEPANRTAPSRFRGPDRGIRSSGKGHM